MDWRRWLSKRRFVLILVLLLALLGLSRLPTFRGTGAINPEVSIDRETDAGYDFAPYLYKFGDLYKAIDENGNVLSQIQKDIIFFARTTRPEFRNPETLVGFTFEDEFKKDGEIYVFTGYYYGLDNKIEVKLTPHGRGVFTLSITNLKDSSNIDDQLSLNGRRNEYIKSLPVQKTRYSIRYQLNEDRVVVTFYDGYTASDVEEAVISITQGLGNAENEDVIYSVNRKGIFTLQRIRESFANPIPEP